MSLNQLSQLVEEKEVRLPNIDKLGRSYGTGRRKSSVARVWIKPGKGNVSINGRTIDEYFPRPTHRTIMLQPFAETKTSGQYDIFCTVKGGGSTGQAGAIRHGVSRALDQHSPELHTLLSKGGFLTRDARAVERKKYGQKKARKRFQFSKR
jgi:small subunit ribosomal protein S9